MDDRKVDGPGGDEHKGLDGKDAAEYHALACEANEESGETCDRNAEGRYRTTSGRCSRSRQLLVRRGHLHCPHGYSS